MEDVDELPHSGERDEADEDVDLVARSSFSADLVEQRW
jgi:hypothetical protein